MTGSEENLEVSEETVAAQPDLPGMPEPEPEPESPTSEELAAAERDALLATVRSCCTAPAVQDAIATAVRVYGELGEPDSVEAFGAWIAALPR